MYSLFKGCVKSTVGMFKYSSQWLSLNFNDQDLLFTDNEQTITSGSKNMNNGVYIYFVHGTGDQACSFQEMAKQLRENGIHDDYKSMHLVSFKGRYQGQGIEDFANQLLQKIKSNEHRKIVLVGHSRGALVCAYLNEYLAKSAGIDVLHCVSICGPFRGSYLAMQPLRFFSNSIEQMSKGSKFLQQLRNKINTEPNSPYTFVIGGLDSVVPNRSGYILEYVKENPKALVRLSDHGHLSIMTSTRLLDYIKKLLNQIIDIEEKQESAKIII